MIQMSPIQPMETAPKDGSYILLFGDSGYKKIPIRCEICKYDANYRPIQPWITYDNESFLDSGGPPIGWLPLPQIPAEILKLLS